MAASRFSDILNALISELCNHDLSATKIWEHLFQFGHYDAIGVQFSCGRMEIH